MKMDQAKIAEYEAKLIYAKNDYERIDQLYKKGVSTKDEMESALSQYKSYQASLLGAKTEFILSEDDYKHCRIYSPISGVIGLTNYTEGNYITPSSGILVTIIQLDPIRVKFSMSTRDFLNNFSDIEGLKKNCTVRIKMADNSFFDEEGAIEFVNNEAVKATDTIQVFAKFKNSKLRLLPNNTVAVYLGNKKGVEKVVIPSTALMYDEDSPYVFVLDDNNVPKRRNVSLGRMDGGRQFVNSGLKAGERVVSDGVHKVIENAKVDIVNRRAMFSKFFIEHPRFAAVISLLLVITGALTIFKLPVADYPEISPPQIRVQATYSGASAEVLKDTVALVI